MTASELYKAGRLHEAIEAQLQEVKAQPADQGKRLFLFELAHVRRRPRPRRPSDRRLEIRSTRAGNRVHVVQEAAGIRASPPALLRRRAGAGLASASLPSMSGCGSRPCNGSARAGPRKPPTLLDQANAAALPVRGTLNGKPFTDVPRRRRPVRRRPRSHGAWAVLLGRHSNRSVHVAMNPPKYPARPAVHPRPPRARRRSGRGFPSCALSEHPRASRRTGPARPDDRLAELENGPTLGMGQHTFLVDEDAVSFLEWREFQNAAEEGPATAP